MLKGKEALDELEASILDKTRQKDWCYKRIDAIAEKYEEQVIIPRNNQS